MHAVDVDLFSPGAQEHWYEAYDILHNEDPVHLLEGEGFLPGTDAYVLTKHDDIAAVVRDEVRFPLPGSMFVRQLVEAEVDPFEQPNVNVLMASIASLRPKNVEIASPGTYRSLGGTGCIAQCSHGDSIRPPIDRSVDCTGYGRVCRRVCTAAAPNGYGGGAWMAVRRP